MSQSQYEMPEQQRLWAYLEQLSDNVHSLGGEIAYGEVFKTEGHPYAFYAPSVADVGEVLLKLGDLQSRLPALEKENQAMRYGDNVVLDENVRLRAEVLELRGRLDPKLPSPRVPIDIYANHAFGED